MPMVNGKKYPYTKQGMADAKKAAKSKPKPKQRPMDKAPSRKPGMMNRKPGRMR